MVLKDETNKNQTPPKSPTAVKTFSNRDNTIRKVVFAYTSKKPMPTMVIEAVRAVSSEEKGASVPAIIKWISGNYAVSDVDKLKLHVKKAVLKALDAGSIIRSETSKGSLGSSGSFVLGKVTKRKSSGKLEDLTKGLPKAFKRKNSLKEIQT